MTSHVGDPGDDARAELERRRAEGLAGPARRAGSDRDVTVAGDPYRVDPAGHRGEDIGILHRYFTPAPGRRGDDPRGPRPLAPRASDR